MLSVCLHKCMCNICMQCLWRPEEGGGSPGTEVRNGCELSYICCKLNLGPLEDQTVLLMAESSLQSPLLVRCVCMGAVCLCVYTWCTHRDQRTTLWSCSSSSTLMWALGIELWPSGLNSEPFYLLSYFTCSFPSCGV